MKNLIIMIAVFVLSLNNQVCSQNKRENIMFEKKIEEARIRDKISGEKWENQNKLQELQHQESLIKKKEMLTHLRQADVKDYIFWLKGFLESDGNISHVYKYKFRSRDFYVVIKDSLEINALYGSMSINIIIPLDKIVNINSLDHINLYYINNFENYGGWIPLFGNIN